MTLLFITTYLFVFLVQSRPPNILFILVDDLGWGEVGYHRTVNDSEVVTPNIDKLVKEESLELNRHYVYQICTPTRSSFQSGRLPCHVQMKVAPPDNPSNGIPRNMTCIANKLKLANYSTHIVGKWDAGMASPDHTPHGRGYDTSLIYFEHKNDFWTNKQPQSGNTESGCINNTNYPDINIIDLWSNDGPAFGENGTMYEEYLFHNRVSSLIDSFALNPTEKWFLVYTTHLAHTPLQLPQDYIFDFDNDESECSVQTSIVYPGQTFNASQYKCRSIYHGMVTLLDTIIGSIVNQLKEKKLWNDTLLILSSDNGGCSSLKESAANNYPLRGAKYSEWEGGIRAAAFVSGGYLPAKRRGQKENGLIHIADWYATFCAMNGIDKTDKKAAKYGLPVVDGYDIWPLISGENITSPRSGFPINQRGIISGNYKYLQGNISFATWSGQVFPNSTSLQHPIQGTFKDCTVKSGGCLFDLVNDMTEHHNIAAENSDIVAKMRNELNAEKAKFYSNNETGVNSCPVNVTSDCACWMSQNYWNGFFGPYQYIPNFSQ
eukprot:531574_1